MHCTQIHLFHCRRAKGELNQSWAAKVTQGWWQKCLSTSQSSPTWQVYAPLEITSNLFRIKVFMGQPGSAPALKSLYYTNQRINWVILVSEFESSQPSPAHTAQSCSFLVLPLLSSHTALICKGNQSRILGWKSALYLLNCTFVSHVRTAIISP